MNHFKHQAIFTILFSFILLFSSNVLSSESSEEQALSQNILTTMNQLLFTLEQNKSKYKDDEALFYQELNTGLSKIINFKRIALKVMGKHGRKASSGEREQFIAVFKQSLYRAYASVLLENNDIKVKMLGSSVNHRNPKKAKTSLEIINGNGSAFPVSYSLHKGKDQIYRVENIVIMGINIGLSFRERFQHQMKLHKGNIKSVINNWSSKVVA